MDSQILKDWSIEQLSQELTKSLYQHVEQRGPYDDDWEEALHMEIERREPKHTEQCFEYHDRGLACGCPAEHTRR